jgi:hypothetical protein
MQRKGAFGDLQPSRRRWRHETPKAKDRNSAAAAAAAAGAAAAGAGSCDLSSPGLGSTGLALGGGLNGTVEGAGCLPAGPLQSAELVAEIRGLMVRTEQVLRALVNMYADLSGTH